MEDVFELAYRYVVPSVRNALVRELVKRGASRNSVASLLNMSRSAVSRYMNDERGVFIEVARFKDVLNMVEKLADEIIREQSDEYIVQEKVSMIAAYFLSRKYFCMSHRRINPRINIVKCKVCKNVFSTLFSDNA